MTKLKKIKLEDAQEGNYAFWKYDQYPFLLGGRIGGWGPYKTVVNLTRGTVRVTSYQMFVKPEFILGDSDGAYLQDELLRLTTKYEAAKHQLNLMMEKAKGAVLAHVE